MGYLEKCFFQNIYPEITEGYPKKEILMKKTVLQLAAAIFFLIIPENCLHAQIITDGTLGSMGKKTLQGPNYDISAEYGRQSGKNLFHSFQEFNIHSGESAAFYGPASVQNIITRVTGGNASQIDGVLSSAIPNADFYLLNPAGVMFGPGAALYLDGSFHVSTADYLGFENEKFYAMPQENEVLSVAAPLAFGFLDSDIAPIYLEGRGDITKESFGTDCLTNEQFISDTRVWEIFSEPGSLRVSEGKNASVIGGDIEITRGTYFKAMVEDENGNLKLENVPLGEIRAPGGRINMAAVASAGEVILKDDDLDVSSFQELGNISLSEKSLLDVAGMQGGSIFIRGGSFFMDDSAIYAYSSESPGFISIETDTLSLTGGSLVGSPSYLLGKGGDVAIHASESVIFSGTDSEDGSPSRIETFSYFGEGGNVTIGGTKNIFLNDGAQINSKSFFGDGGNVAIETKDLLLDNGAEINTASLEGGTGGNIFIKTENLTLSENGSLFAEAENAGGGNIAIDAEKLVQLSSGHMTTSVKHGADNAGDITIAKPEFVALNHSRIRANADSGDGGAIFIHADHYLQSSDSLLDASSKRGNDGTVKIESPDTDISGSLSLLPSGYLPDIPLDSCSNRLGKNAARFIIAGRDGIPLPHDDFLASPPLNPDISQAEAFCRNGDFENAVGFLEATLPHLDKETGAYLHALLYLANAYKATGRYKKAWSVLSEHLPLIENSSDTNQKALLFSELGDIYLILGDMKRAAEYLEKAVDAGRSADNPHILGITLNNMGNFFAADRDDYGAVSSYQESLELAQNPSLKSVALLNLLRISIQRDDEVEHIADEARIQIDSLPESYEKAAYLISLSLLLSESGDQPEKCYELLDRAKRIAENLQDTRTASYAYGYIGELYRNAARYAEALHQTRRAVFYAQQADSPEILYRWQWQLGKIFSVMNNTEKSLEAYHQAIETLNPIRLEFFTGYRDKKEVFYEKIKPVYMELAELLLEESAGIKDEKRREEKLREARDIMELLKIAELQDFFQDDCISRIQSDTQTMNRTPQSTALIYPISLPDHLGLLLTLPNSMKLIKVSANPKEIREWAERFRNCLQNLSKIDRQILFYAQPLYDWLIRPLESELSAQEIDTLIIAPDAGLRLIPFSALHDGEHFLIEKYAVVTVPAISLTDVSDAARVHIRVLFNGLSEEATPPLPGVKKLSENIREITNGGRFLIDEDFTLDNIRQEFSSADYSSVVMATHGIFGGSPQETYLQTSDGRLTMDDLESLIRSGSIQGRTPELLTLNACQTAMGDERAALGLGGIAVKAGVKSVLATLWSVTDKSAALAVTEFYRNLMAGMSKAKALQAAQKKMIAEGTYRHPAYWAPFLLIGNWM